MSNYIIKAEIVFFGGVLNEIFTFLPHMNIISGENGTMKTKLLQAIGRNQLNNGTATNMPPMPHHPLPSHIVTQDAANIKLTYAKNEKLNILAISPKRNTERKTIDNIITQLRNINTPPGIQNELRDSIIEDQTFVNYPSFAELFYKIVDQKNKLGNNQTDNMNETVTEFNKIIKKLFSDYEIEGVWDTEKGRPEITIIKKGKLKLKPEDLSLGELEVLSIIVNIYYNKEKFEVYLIDEPEIHLNWNLEEKLFSFFKWFSETYSKQLIIVTHSRAIFNSNYLSLSQFLIWGEDNKIHLTKEISNEEKKKIAGEAIEIIKLGDLGKKIIFVEDNSHKIIFEEISKKIGKDIHITIAGNSPNVKSLYKFSKTEQALTTSIFIVDGDNEGSQFPGETRFIHLDKYCIENYLLNPAILSLVLEIDSENIKEQFLEIILTDKQKILNKNKYLGFLLEKLNVTDLTEDLISKFDGSFILEKLLEKNNIDFATFVNKYIQKAYDKSPYEILPKTIIDIIFE